MGLFPNFNEMMSQFKLFFTNPMQFMAMRGLKIPQEYSNNPDGAIQYLMDNGKMSQEQYNYLNGFFNQMKRNMPNNGG